MRTRINNISSKNVIFRIIFLLSFIAICSCNKDETEETCFRFKKNGESVTYSSFRTIDNVFKNCYTYIVAGYSEDLLNSINEELFRLNVKILDKE